MSVQVDENRLLAAISALELNLSKQITSEIRSLEAKIEDKVGKQEFELLREHVTHLREHGSSQAALALAQVTSLGSRVDGLTNWRNRIVGALALLVFAIPASTALAIHYL